MKNSRDHNEEALRHLKALNEHREARISKLSTRSLPFNQTNWTEEINKTANTLIVYIDLFKPNQEKSEQVHHIQPSQSSIKELLSSSYSPATDKRIKLWLSYPGVSTAVTRAQ